MLAFLLLAKLANGLSLGLFDTTYDYVIVGGGTAGLTLAYRLSEDPSISVGVVEPGTTYKLSNPIVSDTPLTGALFAGSDLFDTNPFVDWNLKTEPLEGGANRVIHYARGKCLGGSSARNLMLYQRPDKGSMDMWADLIGDESYRWEAFEPFFKKSVKFTPPPNEERGNASAKFDAGDFDPNGGPLSVTYPPYGQPMSSWMIPGMQQSLNIPEIPGFSGGNLMGSSWTALTVQTENKMRESSASAFLDPVRWSRSNLHVHELSTVQRILFDDQKNAVGVELKLGTKIHARREVILSAGAFHSPQYPYAFGCRPRCPPAREGYQGRRGPPGCGPEPHRSRARGPLLPHQR